MKLSPPLRTRWPDDSQRESIRESNLPQSPEMTRHGISTKNAEKKGPRFWTPRKHPQTPQHRKNTKTPVLVFWGYSRISARFSFWPVEIPGRATSGLCSRLRRFSNSESIRRHTPYFHHVRAVFSASKRVSQKEGPGVQFGNPQAICANQAIRANLQIDSRESGHLDPECTKIAHNSLRLRKRFSPLQDLVKSRNCLRLQDARCLCDRESLANGNTSLRLKRETDSHCGT